jgi:drug/metabolite transporter (DMT)-like permease
MAYYLPLLVAVLANVLYHASQRLTPGGANPFLSVGVSFALAALICGALFKATGGGALGAELAKLSWTALGLGVSVALIEVSFLYAYRGGWPVGLASIVVTAGQSALLIPLGRFAFQERLPAQAWLGMALCLAGLALICLAPRPQAS